MRKRRILIPFLSIGLIAALASCSSNAISNNTYTDSTQVNQNNKIDQNNNSNGSSSLGETITPSVTASDAEDNKTEITSTFNIETINGNFTVEDNVYKITSAGTYTLSGKLSEGMIYIDTTGDVELDLNGVSISSSTNSPIYGINLDNLKIKSVDGTYNEIIDNRVTSLTDTLGTAAIYAECDLKLVGKGSLYVSGLYNNGIHTKDDLSIKNVTLSVKAYNNALKGNDSIEIESGQVKAISTGGDGLKTTSSDISSKGNQRGTVTISGGVVDIYACEDGIDASYDVDISGSAVVNIYTSSYSSYSSTHAESSSQEMYVSISNGYYSSNYRYAAYLYNTDGTYTWVNLSYYGMSNTQSMNNNRPGASRTSYYYYKFDLPTGYQNIAIYRFNSTDTENSLDNYSAKTSGGTINNNKNMYAISSISGTTISGDWSTFQVSSSSDYSEKGIKADNEINISDGTINISAVDDALHANYGETLENGNTGLGNINITGGDITVTSGDDGMHADSILNIEGGIINVLNSHEGLEGNQIYIKGGETYVYANDDGVNATSGASSTLINVSGGLLDVTVGSGDTDGIDSNGSYTQSGGVVITRNPNSDKSGNMGALDIDSTFTMTGGTFIAFGVVVKTPSNYNYVSFDAIASGGMGGGMFGGGSSSSSYQFTKGTYTVSNTDITFTAGTTYYSLFIASDQLTVGESYTLSGGTSKTWTQSSKTTTV